MDVPNKYFQHFIFLPDPEALVLAQACKMHAISHDAQNARLINGILIWEAFQHHGFNAASGADRRTVAQDPLFVQLLLLLVKDWVANASIARTLLHTAASEGHMATLRFFLNNNYRNVHDLNTALHRAAFFGRLEAVQLLVENGAQVESAGIIWRGETAHQVASRRGHTAVANFLLTIPPTARPLPPTVIIQDTIIDWQRAHHFIDLLDAAPPRFVDGYMAFEENRLFCVRIQAHLKQLLASWGSI